MKYSDHAAALATKDAQIEQLFYERDQFMAERDALLVKVARMAEALRRLLAIYEDEADLGDPPVSRPAWLEDAMGSSSSALAWLEQQKREALEGVQARIEGKLCAGIDDQYERGLVETYDEIEVALAALKEP